MNKTILAFAAFAAAISAGAADMITAREATNIAECVVASSRTGAARPLPKYLHALYFDDVYTNDAAWYYQQHVPAGSCSARRAGGLLERNYDWNLDESAVFVVRMSASEKDGRFASIGMAGVGTNLTEEIVTSGKWSRYYKCLPGHMLDGVNENGVVAEINVVATNGMERWNANGTVHVLAAVRWALDHGTNAAQAAQFLAANVKRPQGMNFHYMIADKDQTWIVENGAAHSNGTAKVVMTNYALYETGNPGDGKERFRLLDGGGNVTNVWFTNAYRPSETPWTSDLGGYRPQDVWEAWGSGTKEQHRAEVNCDGSPKWWQTVHTSVYDITNRILRVCVQEIPDWYVFSVQPAGGVKPDAVREIVGPMVAGKRDKDDLGYVRGLSESTPVSDYPSVRWTYRGKVATWKNGYWDGPDYDVTVRNKGEFRLVVSDGNVDFGGWSAVAHGDLICASDDALALVSQIDAATNAVPRIVLGKQEVRADLTAKVQSGWTDRWEPSSVEYGGTVKYNNVWYEDGTWRCTEYVDIPITNLMLGDYTNPDATELTFPDGTPTHRVPGTAETQLLTRRDIASPDPNAGTNAVAGAKATGDALAGKRDKTDHGVYVERQLWSPPLPEFEGTQPEFWDDTNANWDITVSGVQVYYKCHRNGNVLRMVKFIAPDSYPESLTSELVTTSVEDPDHVLARRDATAASALAKFDADGNLVPATPGNDFVEPVSGKGLSANDYTNADKAEVAKVKDKVDEFTAWAFEPDLPDGWTFEFVGTHQTGWAPFYRGVQAGVLYGEKDSLRVDYPSDSWDLAYAFAATRKRVLRTGEAVSVKAESADKSVVGGSDASADGAPEDVPVQNNVSVVIGAGAKAQTSDSVPSSTEGVYSRAVAIGAGATASGCNEDGTAQSVAVGLNAQATGPSSVAIGGGGKTDDIPNAATASGNLAIAFGYGSKASTNSSVAIGCKASSRSVSGIAIGLDAKIEEDATASVQLGNGTCRTPYAVQFRGAVLFTVAEGTGDSAVAKIGRGFPREITRRMISRVNASSTPRIQLVDGSVNFVSVNMDAEPTREFTLVFPPKAIDDMAREFDIYIQYTGATGVGVMSVELPKAVTKVYGDGFGFTPETGARYLFKVKELYDGDSSGNAFYVTRTKLVEAR